MSRQDPSNLKHAATTDVIASSKLFEGQRGINGGGADSTGEMEQPSKKLGGYAKSDDVPYGTAPSIIKKEATFSPLAPSIKRPMPSSEQPSKRICLQQKPTDKVAMHKLIIEWKINKLDLLRESYNEHLFELYFLKHEGNLMDMQNWLKKPPSELFHYVKKRKLEGDDSAEAKLTGNKLPQIKFNTIKSEFPVNSGELSHPSTASSNTNKSPKNVGRRPHSSGDFMGNSSHQDQMVEKARHEAHIIQRINALRKEGLWSEKKLPRVQEPQRPKVHWDYLLEEMVWLSSDFSQERKWKKAAAKKCAKMVQKYFQDKVAQAQKAEKEHEVRLKKIASFAAKEIRIFWGNIGKIIEYKVNTRLDEKKKKALDQQLSFIVDQTEKYSSMLAESMKKPAESFSTAPADLKLSPRSAGLSDGEFQPNESSSDDEGTIAKEEDNPEDQVSELKLLQKDSEQTLEDLLGDLPLEYFQSHVDEFALDGSSTQEEESRKMQTDEKVPEPTDSLQSLEKDTPEPMEVDKIDKDFEANETDEDDENTIMEQEQAENPSDYHQELKDLEAESEMSVEELKKKYEVLAASSEPFVEDVDDEDSQSTADKQESKNDENVENLKESLSSRSTPAEEVDKSETVSAASEDKESESEAEEEAAILTTDDEDGTLGLEDLVDKSFHEEGVKDESKAKERSEMADKELQDASAVAESLQPKGFTLSSTSVTTPIPFLLKHTLREYQHVGLDWLVTMYEKKLNGILADEMGLGKTIQTIALLAHLACEKSIWGPHLIIVPTSVMLNWEMEFKKWCPAFKILTYYGSQKERKLKRQGWTKLNAFHVCITSYKLVIQDHQSFRRKKWKYFILDEAQNIKNFKSQRWQLLLNFQSQRRLLLTGTPLQNSLMELWSLMHFLMPNIFASHREFRDWFSNPVTGMIEGNKEYNDSIIKRLHKVLRPFILRRLKSEVEQQMPKKFEHIVMCRLSKRQRFLYEEFMARTKTKETLASGNFLSVINILMQLRKVCNHPNLFEPRPTVSPFMMDGLSFIAPSCVYGLCEYDPFLHVDLFSLNLLLSNLELCLTAFAAHRIRRFQALPKLIEEIDSAADPPPKCPAGKIKLHVRPSSQPVPRPGSNVGPGQRPAPSILTLKPVATTASQSSIASSQGFSSPNPSTSATSSTSAPQWQTGVRFQLVQHGNSYKAIPLPPGSTGGMLMQQTPQGPRLVMPQRQVPQPSSVTTSSVHSSSVSSSATTNANSGAGALGGLQLVQTSTGQYILTSSPIQKPANSTTTSLGVSGNTAVALLQRLQGLKSLQGSVITTGAGGRPVLRLPTSSLRPNIQIPTSHISQNQTGQSTNLPPSKPSTSLNTPQSTPVPSPSKGVLNQSASQAPSTSNSPISSPSKGLQTRSQTQEAREESQNVPLKKKESVSKSIFCLNDLEESRKQKRKEKLHFIAQTNTRRCLACPIYGADLIEAVTVTSGLIKNGALNRGFFNGQGYIHCNNATFPTVREYWLETSYLKSCVRTPIQWLDDLRDTLERFVFCVPPVIAPQPTLRVCHPHPSLLWQDQCRDLTLKEGLVQPLAPLHSISNASATQFPDVRLIQYDCGKLQTLDRLLRRLKIGSHRVLIFTQMTRMLDIFEAFLNYHGYLYLRLDGTTKVDQRQSLMERFNQDKRIFAMILSTRSGGIGVNLTGADTVIFYDSDWNPTMDAQAQDRCHRIGQTRDVHIYRLISEKTIEENILKKANQKRLLGDLAIEGGNFTTAQLKTHTISQLFEVDANEQDASKRMSEVLDKDRQPEESGEVEGESDNHKIGALESALAVAEDETDVQAMKTAKAEAAADLAEFDENIPFEDAEMKEVSKAEQELAQLMKQLTPIEKYAMQFLEASDEGLAAEAERLSAEIDQQKKEWEIERLQALQEEEERLKQNSDEDLLTYSSIDAHNQMWVSFGSKEVMPIWQPPTPPRDDNDLYIDQCLTNWYELGIMSESELPPVYVLKENNKRLKSETLPPADTNEASNMRLTPKTKQREETVYAPHSLFDRASPAVMKMRRDLKFPKNRAIARTSTISPLKTPSLIGKPILESETVAEWLVHEDWNILQAVQQILQLPLSLIVVSPGHVPNWDLVSDFVNSSSVCYRSPRNCRTRYETIILPREETKEINNPPDVLKKITKKVKMGASQRPQNIRGMGTSQLFQQDNNSKFSSLNSTRFEILKGITVKRIPTTKPMYVNPSAKNPKHSQTLTDYSIQYEEPLSPSHVALKRSERLQMEKQKTRAAELVQHQTRLHLQQQQQQQTSPAQQITVNLLQQSQQQPQQQVHQFVQAGQPQQQMPVISVSNNTLQLPQQQSVVVSNVTPLGTKVASTSVVLTQGTGGTLVSAISASVNSNTANALTTVTASTPACTNSSGSLMRSTVTTQGVNTGRTTISLQDFQSRATGASQATVVSVASLAQLQAAKLSAPLTSQGTQARGVPVQARALTPQQIQYLRQQAQRQNLAFQSAKAIASSTPGEQQTIKRVQIAGQAATGQKLQVAVPPGAVSGGAVQSIAALQVTQAGRAHLVKSTISPGTGAHASGSGTQGKGVTRTVTESEMNALLRRQPQQLTKTGGIAQVLAKQRSLVNMKGATVGLLGTKGTIGGTGLSTVQILQPGGSTQKHMTVQQIHQVLKQVQQPQGIQQLQQGTVTGTVVGKAVVSGATAPQTQPIKQTIQVVSAGSQGTISGTQSTMRVNSTDRPTGITLQGNTVRVTNPTILSQVSAALQGQPVSVAVRPTANPVRIQTTSVTSQQQQAPATALPPVVTQQPVSQIVQQSTAAQPVQIQVSQQQQPQPPTQ